MDDYFLLERRENKRRREEIPSTVSAVPTPVTPVFGLLYLLAEVIVVVVVVLETVVAAVVITVPLPPVFASGLGTPSVVT